MKSLPRGWWWGPCWHHCNGVVAWPPNTVTAEVVCDNDIRGPHRGVVEASRYPKEVNR